MIKELILNLTFQSDKAQQQRITEFKITGMTCTGCEEHVNHEVNKLSGSLKSNTSFEDGNAIIEFDSSKTSETEMEKAINSTGYKATDKKAN